MKSRKERAIIKGSSKQIPSRKCKCGSEKIITDYKHGEILCKDCGLVLSDRLFNPGPEWRAFDIDQLSKRSRAGPPLKFAKQNTGLTTEIDRYDRDIKGSAVPSERKAQLYRLRKWQIRSRMGTSIDRNLSIALPELDMMCNLLNVPGNAKEECARLYRKCVDKGIVKGRSIESMIAGIILYISKTSDHCSPVLAEELEKVSGVSEKYIERSYKKICRGLKLRVPKITPAAYVSKYASQLGMSGQVEIAAIDLINKYIKESYDVIISGSSPTMIALAALAFCKEGGRELSRSELSQILGVNVKKYKIPRIKEIYGSFKKKKDEIENLNFYSTN